METRWHGRSSSGREGSGDDPADPRPCRRGGPRHRPPTPATPAPPPQAAPPAPPPVVERESPVEAFYAARLPPGIQPLRLFGYDAFLSLPVGGQPDVAGLPDDNVLGRDDELVVTLRGRISRTVSARIDRDGRLILPDLEPIDAAGCTLLDLRRDLAARLACESPGTEAFVSVGGIRQIQVFVGGEVVRPGFQALTSLASCSTRSPPPAASSAPARCARSASKAVAAPAWSTCTACWPGEVPPPTSRSAPAIASSPRRSARPSPLRAKWAGPASSNCRPACR